MSKPLCIDLFCGLGGWAEGFIAEGYDVVGFDIERHRYPGVPPLGFPETTGNRAPIQQYPAQLVIQDVLTLHGSQFRNAAVIVASPPCQAYSRRAMPFGALWLEHNRMDDDGAPAGNYLGKDPIFNDLFRACFRIQREACEAAGHHIPLVVENVKGAQSFVGRARFVYRSFYLWGDVPALMPEPIRKGKNGALGGGSWFGIGSRGQTVTGMNPDGRMVGRDGHKEPMRNDPRDIRRDENGDWVTLDGLKFGGGWWHDSSNNLIRKASSRSRLRRSRFHWRAGLPIPSNPSPHQRAGRRSRERQTNKKYLPPALSLFSLKSVLLIYWSERVPRAHWVHWRTRKCKTLDLSRFVELK